MIEYTIQNHPELHFMRPVHQFLQIVCGAEGRVDRIIINGVILMGGIGPENRCQINYIHTKIMDVVQMGDDTPQ